MASDRLLPTHELGAARTNGTPARPCGSAISLRRALTTSGWVWQEALARWVLHARRKALYIKFKIRDQDVFGKALGYIREYY
ncbi:hypothetical protein [Streptomyces sp. NPDC001680]